MQRRHYRIYTTTTKNANDEKLILNRQEQRKHYDINKYKYVHNNYMYNSILFIMQYYTAPDIMV